MTAISLFMAANVELFAVLSTILSICFVLLRSRGRPGEEECSPESPPVDRKQVPRKLSRKSTAKKKKNKSAQWLISSLNQCKAMECQTEGQMKELGDENDRKRGRNRKARYASTKSQADVNIPQQKTVKLYSPLPIYTKLKMDISQLYHSILPYTLNVNDLQTHGFPLENPANPGKVLLYNSCSYAEKPRDPTERWCCRCGTKFSVTKDGEYQAETSCRYHLGKRLSIGGIAGIGAYSCCPHDSMAEGCVANKHHVSSQTTLHDRVFLKTRYKRLPHPGACPQIYALDCEMCYTMQGLEVARISVVGIDGLAIYDSYVIPENPILDYNTAYSGITANDLKDVTTTLADVQAFLLKRLNSRTILVGHGLENDLKALRIIHEAIVDTSIVFPHPYGTPYKRSLKFLAEHVLKKTIQDGESGHDSVEDARTCIELMLLKIEADKQMAQSQEFHPFIPNVQPWPLTARPVHVSPFITPCSVGYWVPPVGSCCELY